MSARFPYRVTAVLLVGASLMFGQFGGRLPRRGPSSSPSSTSTSSSEKKPAAKTVSIAGVVVQTDERSLMIEAADTRILTFKITEQTQFGVPKTGIKPGDHLQIEGTQDNEANLTATRVAAEGAASTSGPAPEPATPSSQASASPGGDDPDRPRLRRAAPETSGSTATESSSARPEPARAPVASAPIADNSRELEDNDPNRPKLRRGTPRQRAVVPEPEEAPAPNRPTLKEGAKNSIANDTGKPNDPLIQRAMDVAESFSEELPNYVCQQFTTRYIRTAGDRGFRALDVVQANVVYENKKESYRDILINGKPAKKSMEELPGAWSTGEFGTTLRSLFSPRTAADFRFRKESIVNGLQTKVYEYSVERLRSDWRIQLGGQAIIPAYKGRVWIDTKNARVLRIEMEAVEIPEEFPLDHIEAANDYGFVRLGGTTEFLLPTHAENLSCERGSSNCARNAIDFRNYHKYAGESSITFDK